MSVNLERGEIQISHILCGFGEQGFVVGSSGSKLYCLLGHTMQTFDAPLSAVLEAFLGHGDFEKAHQVCFHGLLLDAKCPYFRSILHGNFEIS